MTNPNNAIGTNAAYGTRTSVNAFNDSMQLASGRGVLSGFAVVPKSGMTVSVGGVAGTRDVAVAEDNLGNRVCINNRLASAIDITIPAASVSSDRYDAIVVYENNPAQASDTTPDAPGVCGIIVVSGNSTGVSEAQIRSAITADGGTGSVAYYATLATIKVSAGTTTISSGNISQSNVSAFIPDGAVTTSKVASSAISNAKVDWSTFGVAGSLDGPGTTTTKSNGAAWASVDMYSGSVSLSAGTYLIVVSNSSAIFSAAGEQQWCAVTIDGTNVLNNSLAWFTGATINANAVGVATISASGPHTVAFQLGAQGVRNCTLYGGSKVQFVRIG